MDNKGTGRLIYYVIYDIYGDEMSKKKFMYGTLHSKFTKYDRDVFFETCWIGGIVAGLLALPSIYSNPMEIFYAAVSGAFVCGGLYVAAKIVEGMSYIQAEREMQGILDTMRPNQHEGEVKQ